MEGLWTETIGGFATCFLEVVAAQEKRSAYPATAITTWRETHAEHASASQSEQSFVGREPNFRLPELSFASEQVVQHWEARKAMQRHAGFDGTLGSALSSLNCSVQRGERTAS